MRRRIAIASLVIALLSIAWSGHGQTGRVKSVSYEYNVISDPTFSQGKDEGLTTLNRLGSQGWEITGVVQHGDMPPTLYLKRVRK